MSESVEWTEDDVQRLSGALQTERPDLWEAYIQGESRGTAVSGPARDWIDLTMRRLFPGKSFADLTRLLRLFRAAVQRQIVQGQIVQGQVVQGQVV